MVSALEVKPTKLIEQAAKQLEAEKLVEPTEWAPFVKTGANKERHPDRTDWWFVRAAAILRTVYSKGPVGTNKLRTKYGGRKRRGHKKAEFRKGSGSIIRNILQQLEKSGLIKQEAKGAHKGRVITPKGKSVLDKIAVTLLKKKQ